MTNILNVKCLKRFFESPLAKAAMQEQYTSMTGRVSVHSRSIVLLKILASAVINRGKV